MRFSGVVLAGGESRRMGRDKARLVVGGELLLKRQIRVLQDSGATEVLVSVRRPGDYHDLGVPAVCDGGVGKGPLAGIVAALEAASEPLVFVLGVDMPGMTPDLIRRMLDCCHPPDCGAIAEFSSGLEPLAAIYPRVAGLLFREELRAGRYAVYHAVQLAAERNWMRICTLDPKYAAGFANWNTPDDIRSNP